MCEYCDHSFSTQKILTKHKTHAKYCLEIQGKKVQKYTCTCGKKYFLKDSMQRHQASCVVHNDLNRVTDIIHKDAQYEAMQFMLRKYETLIEGFQKQVADLSNKPTTTNNNNVTLQNLPAITDEVLQEDLNNLSLDFIQKGAKGFAAFATSYPFKGAIICTDKARKKIKYRNAAGDITDDSRTLAQRFFQAISARNKEILDRAYKDIHEEIKGVVAENRAHEVDITGLLTKATDMQNILIKTQKAAQGEDDEFVREFLGHLTKLL